MTAKNVRPARYGCVVLLIAIATVRAAAADSLDDCSRGELVYYRHLAMASELSYDDTAGGLVATPSGLVALVHEESDGTLIIAFRGSMLGDRNPRHPFTNLGGAVVRRNYRDWVATNLKQTAGFLPRQYTEAADLVREQLLANRSGRPVYVTGHSKGGGAAVYAYAAACLDPDITPEEAGRLHCVTFNAAVVRERNWQRLEREVRRRNQSDRRLAPGSITSLIMADDPVSKIAAGEERDAVRRIVIHSRQERSGPEQHAITTILEEIETRLSEKSENRPPAR